MPLHHPHLGSGDCLPSVAFAGLAFPLSRGQSGSLAPRTGQGSVLGVSSLKGSACLVLKDERQAPLLPAQSSSGPISRQGAARAADPSTAG